jgi:transglutaminase-like putative cysteine protease
MRYRITHLTAYHYEAEVSVSHHLLHLQPRPLPHQRILELDIEVQPEPTSRASRTDHFGNHAEVMTIEGAHRRLEITAHSLVEIDPAPCREGWTSPAWESVVEACSAQEWSEAVEAGEFRFDSPHVRRNNPATVFARRSFPAGRSWLEAVTDLCGRIHREFEFDPRATTLSTPVEEVLAGRKGVCQDFAHLMLSCLRSLGLPARYVSGYIETLPPPGKARLVGADATHAWVSAFCPGLGWLDFDPTNGIVPGERHVTVAWGRDYSDVSPVRGVLVGSGSHSLKVSVDVEPQVPPAAASTP